MTTNVLEKTGEQIADSAEKMASVLKHQFDSAKHLIRDGAEMADDLIQDTTRQIRRHPAASVATTFLVAFGLGFVTGWVIRKK